MKALKKLVSIDGVETTRIIELVKMIKVLEDYLSQVLRG